MDGKIRNKKNEILKKMNFPREVITGEPKIVVIGGEEITIENHRGVKRFDENKVVLNTNIGELSIEGKNFEILFIEEATIVIKGEFIKLYYGVDKNE